MIHTTNAFLTEKFEAVQPMKIVWISLLATSVMSAFILILPLTGLPALNIPELLSTLLHGNIVAGWVLHFAIGLIYAFIYVMFFNHTIPAINDTLRGMLFGIPAFMVSQTILLLLVTGGYITGPEKESATLMAFANCAAHLLYGSVLGSYFKNK
ncbi:MAG TPA: hypothetical protein PLW44_05330 [Chitinophagales bacterium]|nr:hypothetical protein [Chitinophagales bacterium]